MTTFCYEIVSAEDEIHVSETFGTCRVADISAALRRIIDKHYGRSCGWHPEGQFDPEPDTRGKVWYRGYVTRWSARSNAHSVQSPLLRIKIWPETTA